MKAGGAVAVAMVDEAIGRVGGAGGSVRKARVRLPVIREADLDADDEGLADAAEGDDDLDEDATDAAGATGDAAARPARRRHWRRARTVSIKRLSKAELERGRLKYPVAEHKFGEGKPETLGECESLGLGGATPCPYVSCAYHLFLDVSEDTGSIKLNFPPRDESEEALEEALRSMPSTCAFAAIDRGDLTLEATGEAYNITRERTRQIEGRALAKVVADPAAMTMLGMVKRDPDLTTMAAASGMVARFSPGWKEVSGRERDTAEDLGRLLDL